MAKLARHGAVAQLGERALAAVGQGFESPRLHSLIRHILFGLAVVAMVAGCGGEGGDADGQSVDVMFTRTDGSQARFPDTVRAWCGPYDEDNRDIEAVNVLAGEAPRDESPDAYWIVTAVRADIERDPVTTFPNSFVFSEPRGAGLFAYDGDDRGNELSSADEESKGTMRIELEGCEPGDTGARRVRRTSCSAASTPTCRRSRSRALSRRRLATRRISRKAHSRRGAHTTR